MSPISLYRGACVLDDKKDQIKSYWRRKTLKIVEVLRTSYSLLPGIDCLNPGQGNPGLFPSLQYWCITKIFLEKKRTLISKWRLHSEIFVLPTANRFILFEIYNLVSKSSTKVPIEPNLQHRVGKPSQKRWSQNRSQNTNLILKYLSTVLLL